MRRVVLGALGGLAWVVGCTSAPASPRAEEHAEPIPFDSCLGPDCGDPGGTVLPGVPPPPAVIQTNADPAKQIRFADATSAEARRAALIDFVFGGPLPSALPAVTVGVEAPDGLDDMDLDDVASIDRLESTIPDSSLTSRSFLFHPSLVDANNDRVVIVHQGHAATLVDGVGKTAGHLLAKGFRVLVMNMPLYGWNAVDAPYFGSHWAMFPEVTDEAVAHSFREFLQPVVVAVNHVRSALPQLEDVSMIGLSGGGWTTAMMAAIDVRIATTIQVAGSAPLYARLGKRKWIGDLEQVHATMFSEDIADDGTGGGIATWLEIYALGGLGQGRRTIQVTNEFDPCCFSGHFADDYRTLVADRVSAIGPGSFEYVRDATHQKHQISDHVREAVIDPALGIAP